MWADLNTRTTQSGLTAQRHRVDLQRLTRSCNLTAMSSAAKHPIAVPWWRVKPLLSQARAAGIDVEDLFRALGLDPALLSQATGADLSLANYYRIQNRLSILFGDETLHLSSRQLLPGSTDFVLQHVGGCKNLHEVMRVIAKSYNLLHGGQYNSVVKKAASVDYIIDDRQFPYIAGQSLEDIYFSIECVLIFLHCMLMIVSPRAKNAITELQIRRPSPGGECDHLSYWDAPIKFGADAYRVSFNRDIALRALRPPDADALTSNAVYQKIVDVVAGEHAHYENLQSTSSLVRDALSRGVVEQSDVAAQMGVSVATLRRRLADEETGFRDLRRDVLNETAKRLLLTTQSIADVSEVLGFSEFRAFNRAFKDWNGVTPTAFRRDAKIKPGAS